MGNDAVHHLRHHGINASRHWRSSTIGVSYRMRSSIKAIRELIAIMAGCALLCLLPDWTGRRFRSVATSRGEIHDRDVKPPGI